MCAANHTHNKKNKCQSCGTTTSQRYQQQPHVATNPGMLMAKVSYITTKYAFGAEARISESIRD
jgi:hypothetical protein